MGTHDLRLRLAQIAEREGRRKEAAGLYAQVLCGDRYRVEAWWGLSQTVCAPARALYCLKRVLALAPGHVEALHRLNQMTADVMLDDLTVARVARELLAAYDTPVFA